MHSMVVSPYAPIDPYWDEYIAKSNISIESNPESALLYYGRGIAYLFKGEYDKAINDFEKVAEIERGKINSKLIEAARQALEATGK
jgi:tetratricopeptide (TPR) repeat protein